VLSQMLHEPFGPRNTPRLVSFVQRCTNRWSRWTMPLQHRPLDCRMPLAANLGLPDYLLAISFLRVRMKRLRVRAVLD